MVVRELEHWVMGTGTSLQGWVPQGHRDLVWGLDYQKPRRAVLSHSAGQTLRSQNQNKSRYVLTQKIATRHATALNSRPGPMLEEEEQGTSREAYPHTGQPKCLRAAEVCQEGEGFPA